MHTKTLLLAPWYLPVRVISWESAVKLVYEGNADVVAEYDEEIRSPSVTWKMPAVIRLKRLGKRQRSAVRYSRLGVYMRDGWRCQYCSTACSYAEATRDHVVPRAHGGRTTWSNTCLACRDCNSKKGSLSCDEAGMFPIREPVEPKVLPNAPMVVRGPIPDEWMAFVRNV